LSLICVSLSVSAASVKDKKVWKQAVAEVDEVKTDAEGMCALEFGFGFDRDSFLANTTLDELGSRNMGGYCGDAFDAMEDLCDDEDYKEAMASIKSVSCVFNPGLDAPAPSMNFAL